MTDPRTIMGPMAVSLEATTGRSVEEWLTVVEGLGLRSSPGSAAPTT
jgi:hypothetical protein